MEITMIESDARMVEGKQHDTLRTMRRNSLT